MRELNLAEIEIVSGGRLAITAFFSDWFLGNALDWAVEAVSSGQVDYAGTVEANSSYCAIGA